MRRLPFARAADREASARIATDHLAAGGIVAYPTETVYGLGCTLDPAPLERLARLKDRRGDQPFLLVVRSADDVADLRWTAEARRLAETFWPGPLTLALADPDGRYPPEVRSQEGTVAVRVSPHPAVAALLEAMGRPLTSTSANAPGAAPARDPEAAVAAVTALGGNEEVVLLDGGALPPSKPSTIVDCSVEPPRVIRIGAISPGDLEAHDLQL